MDLGKVISDVFLGADGQVSQTKSQKFKDAIIWMVIGAALAIAGLFFFADDDSETNNSVVSESVQ